MKLTPEEYRQHRLAQRRESYWRHRDRYLAERREKDPQTHERSDKWKAARAAQKRSYEKHKDKYRAKKRAAYQANKHWEAVRNRRQMIQRLLAGRPRPDHCDACGDESTRIEFDHCHQRGVFRGWLCTHCNVILGHARDNPNLLRKLIAYLERTKDVVSPQMTLPV